jgi:hypothetical protein
MNLDQKYLNEFFEAIDLSLPGYTHSFFSYIALKSGEAFVLNQGQLVFRTMPAIVPPKYFASENIRAGFFRIEDLKSDPKSMINNALAGVISTPHGDLRFPPAQHRSHSIYFSPFHSDGVPTQLRQMNLFIRGDRRPQLQTPKLDWEVRSAKTPYDGLQDLLRDIMVGALTGDTSEIRVIAHNIVAISDESIIHADQARLVMRLANGLDPAKSSIGVRVLEKQAVAKRYTIDGAALSWKKTDSFQCGEISEEVPSGAILQCVACYDGQAQHYWWVSDPQTAQNPFRVIHDVFDNKLGVLHELVEKAQSRGSNARDLEIAVEWLLWMLGFSPTHIGGPSRMSEAPDLIAATPQGNILVVECTTGILKEDSKLAHLVQRAEKIRQTLNASNNQHLKVLPIIATTKTRDEVKAELEQAHKMGVFVATREDFDRLITRTLAFPDASRLYAEAEATLLQNQNQLTSPINEG